MASMYTCIHSNIHNTHTYTMHTYWNKKKCSSLFLSLFFEILVSACSSASSLLTLLVSRSLFKPSWSQKPLRLFRTWEYWLFPVLFLRCGFGKGCSSVVDCVLIKSPDWAQSSAPEERRMWFLLLPTLFYVLRWLPGEKGVYEKLITVPILNKYLR